MDKSVCLCPTFSFEHIKLSVLDKFLFIVAERGPFCFKKVLLLNKIQKSFDFKAYYSSNFVRLSSSPINVGEMELPILRTREKSKCPIGWNDSVCLDCNFFSPNDIKIDIIDDLLIIKASCEKGTKGINFSRHKFKTAILLAKDTNVKVYFSSNFVRIGSVPKNHLEFELPVSRYSSKLPPKPCNSIQPVNNCQNFLKALRDIGMLK